MTADQRRAETNRLIAYHSTISGQMTLERTALESALIPVSAYILVAATEAWFRHPEMIAAIDAAKPAGDIGAAGRRPGSQINAVYLWSLANIYLVGRKLLTSFQLVEDAVDPTHTMLEFWERAALGYHVDGHRQAWDAGFVLRPYDDDVVAALMAGVRPVASGAERDRIKRWNATVMSYLFLLYFDTRVGTGDSGPYPLADGRVLLVRDFYRLGPSDFWWSDVAKAMPYSYLTAALVLDGVDLKVNDWGTSITDPEDYLDHLVGFGLFTTDSPDRSLRPVDPGELDDLLAEVRSTQRLLYRSIAGMSRDDKIACGAYVYFTFPRPLAEEAGIADRLDWHVPRDTLVPRDPVGRLYDLLSPISGANEAPDLSVDYYAPIQG
ncbi:MAG: hypothetical protein ACYDH6_20970 [Acidimicrobiales bacterium]